MASSLIRIAPPTSAISAGESRIKEEATVPIALVGEVVGVRSRHYPNLLIALVGGVAGV